MSTCYSILCVYGRQHGREPSEGSGGEGEVRMDEKGWGLEAEKRDIDSSSSEGLICKCLDRISGSGFEKVGADLNEF